VSNPARNIRCNNQEEQRERKDRKMNYKRSENNTHKDQNLVIDLLTDKIIENKRVVESDIAIDISKNFSSYIEHLFYEAVKNASLSDVIYEAFQNNNNTSIKYLETLEILSGRLHEYVEKQSSFAKEFQAYIEKLGEVDIGFG